MTLIELMTAMTMSLLLIAVAGTMVTVFSKAEASTVNSTNAAAMTRLTLLQFQHDVQSAVPLDPLSTSGCGATSPWASTCYSAYDDTLQVTIQPSGSVVTWQLVLTGPMAGDLTRQVGSSPAVVQLTNVTNGDPTTTGIPIFHYFDACANDLVVQSKATNSAPTSVALNATVVQITLAVANVDSAPYGTTTSVNVMNKSPGITPSC
jgi:hypothetical protein